MKHRATTAVALAASLLISSACAFSPSSDRNNINFERRGPRPLLASDARLAEDAQLSNDDGAGAAGHNGVGGGSDDVEGRRKFLASLSCSIGIIGLSSATLTPWKAAAEDAVIPAAALPEVQVVATGDVKKLFNEGRALEAQGNILAAQRLYVKVTKIAPRFIYGWSNLGNALVAQGKLGEAEESYGRAVSLCEENLKETEGTFGVRRCDDLYLILLNRGSVRLNNDMPKEALRDLAKANTLRARPDAVILQNLARAQELNSFFTQSDTSYTTAISMTANEVNPFWLRSSLVKYQLGDAKGAMDLLKRVENRFPEAPEVRAAYATLLWGKGDEDAARKKFLEIPDRQRVRYADGDFLDKVVSWPAKAKSTIGEVAKAVGDNESGENGVLPVGSL